MSTLRRSSAVRSAFLALALPAMLPAVLSAASADYKVVAHFKIGGGNASYDYLRVDPTARRIFVAHEKRFEVIDADTGAKLGEIAPTTRAHGVAIAPEAGHGFASSGSTSRPSKLSRRSNPAAPIPMASSTIPRPSASTWATTAAAASPSSIP